ncbi:hypothetical protein DSO57_1005679 [Entomophthora muscae]|uniref:Uncharacterized protein n=1 Tax=Entomophthora muscae TaxID=34485 RepID=A0ACC2RZ04_9FUNG|nr:hypothetical protein DSO57_1005679 [Entomophthora muscae]
MPSPKHRLGRERPKDSHLTGRTNCLPPGNNNNNSNHKPASSNGHRNGNNGQSNWKSPGRALSKPSSSRTIPNSPNNEYCPKDVDQCPMIQVPLENPVLYTVARNSNKLMSYSFCFCSYTGSALLNSGANQTLVNSSFVDKFKLATNPSRIKNVVLANEHHIAVTNKMAPFSIMLESLHSNIQGPVIDFPKFDVVLILDLLQRNNPHADWATSALTLKREGVNCHGKFHNARNYSAKYESLESQKTFTKTDWFNGPESNS